MSVVVNYTARDGVTRHLHAASDHQSASDALLDLAVDVDADLIVISTRRRSPVGKLFLGSTAQEILLAADVPVLLVKP